MTDLSHLQLDMSSADLLCDTPGLRVSLETADCLWACPLIGMEQSDPNLPAVGHTKERNGSHMLRLQRDTLYVVGDTTNVPEVSSNAHDQSHAWNSVNISGEMTPALMERLCMLDVTGPGFPPGRISRTLMDHTGVIAWHINNAEFKLFVATSYTSSLVERVRQCAKDLLALHDFHERASSTH
ncbi:MAG: hypothetical protein AAFY73_05000 [Pseudomonadota bacterium]